eukprot:gene13845-5655_t
MPDGSVGRAEQMARHRVPLSAVERRGAATPSRRVSRHSRRLSAPKPAIRLRALLRAGGRMCAAASAPTKGTVRAAPHSPLSRAGAARGVCDGAHAERER